VIEIQVHALVSNDNIDSAGFDPGTSKYRIRINIRGEQLIREIESRIIK
jgi:hypothetical protein